MAELTRREVIQGAIAAGVTLTAASVGRSQTTQPVALSASVDPMNTAEATWLDSKSTELAGVGVTWGVPWARGLIQKNDSLRVESKGGKAVPSQAWPTAFWPDGSVKWSAVAVGPTAAEALRVGLGTPAVGDQSVRVQRFKDHTTVSTGAIDMTFDGPNASDGPISVSRNGKTALTHGRFVLLRQGEAGGAPTSTREAFVSEINEFVIEQEGPVRAVIKLAGTFSPEGNMAVDRRQWLPFVVRLYFYAGSDVIRIMHSFVFDGDEKKDFIAGLGLTFDVPMRDQLYDRHFRLIGQDNGLFGEAVRGITGLRRDPGDAVRKAQIDGTATPPLAEWAPSVSKALDLIPSWGDFTLSQLCADGFQIRKRTKDGCAWIPAGAGKRAAGVGYIGGATGGVSFGLRDFWEKHPTQLGVRNATSDKASVTLWLWSPEAQPMDLRTYHDVMGMETYDQQRAGLDITYEDYEPGYDTPYGVARTSEMFLRIEATTPSRESLVAFADIVRKPPVLMVSAKHLHDSGVFGRQWTLPDSSTPTKQWIEKRLDSELNQYLKEIDQRSWYGFWDHGDVMHTYDNDRHVWRYDVGGFAWDNSELSTDLWLWLSVLRTGRADLFRMAEAMCRHTGEVDVYHLGRFKGLGTRHGVQHWFDSSKQSRISTPIYRRIYYYLTADERVGDLLTEQLHTIEAEKKIVVGRKIKPGSPTLPLPAVEDGPPGGDVPLGPMNYGNTLVGWMTQAERTGDPAWHKKIIEAMRGMGELPKGFYTSGWAMNADTGHITHNGDPAIVLSHLNACFGLPEAANELIDLYGDQAPKFGDAWAQYGRLYNGTNEQRAKELGDAFKPATFKEASLRDHHSRCTAFAAIHDKDDALRQRAWAELLGNKFTPDAPLPTITHITGPAVLNPIDEQSPIGTNGAAQWGLAAMECLALIGDSLK